MAARQTGTSTGGGGTRGIVVAAVMEGADGRILACQRRKGDRHELKWEFPGGKVEFGEDPVSALNRELREELGIEARIGAEIGRYEFAYPGKLPIELIFFEVGQWSGELENRIFAEIRWCDPRDFPSMDFLEGDIDFVRRLARRGPRPQRLTASL